QGRRRRRDPAAGLRLSPRGGRPGHLRAGLERARMRGRPAAPAGAQHAAGGGGGVKLGFSVEELLPRARGGGPLKMALNALVDEEWLQPEPDLAARAAAFDAHPESVQLLADAEAPAGELAALLGVSGGLEQAARAVWEDLCVLTRRDGEDVYRLVGTAVAFPTDWRPVDKLGLPLVALHKPIHGYEEQLATGVDHFMAKLQPGKAFGRCNWFVSPTGALRWVAEPPEESF